MKKCFIPGVFDFFHEGHVNLIERARNLSELVVIGVINDEGVERKGKKSFYSLDERINMIKEKYPDFTIIETDGSVENYNDIYNRYEIDFHVVGHDHIGTDKTHKIQEILEVVFFERTEGISSTKLRCENKEESKEF